MGTCSGKLRAGSGDAPISPSIPESFSMEWVELGMYTVERWAKQGFQVWNFAPNINYDNDCKYRFQPWTTGGRHQRPIITNSDYFELGAFVAMVAGTHGHFLLIVEKKTKHIFSWKIVSQSQTLKLEKLDECQLEVEKPVHVIGARNDVVVLQVNRNMGIFEGYVLKDYDTHMKVHQKVIFECPEADRCIMEAIISPDCTKILLKPSWVHHQILSMGRSASRDFNDCVYFLDLEKEDDMMIAGTFYVNEGHQMVIAFDPRFAWSKICVGNRWASGADDNLAIVDLRDRRRLAYHKHTEVCPVQNITYSKDGTYIAVLEGEVPSSGHGKIQPQRVKVFTSKNLNVLKVFTNLGGGLKVNVTPFGIFPLFSEDNRQMAIMYHTSRKYMVSVYNVPIQLNLMNLCRIKILKISSEGRFPKDHFPKDILDYLAYKPVKK